MPLFGFDSSARGGAVAWRISLELFQRAARKARFLGRFTSNDKVELFVLDGRLKASFKE